MRLRVETIATILALASALAACGRREMGPAAKRAEGPARDVETAAVVRAGGAGEIAVPGAVQARQRAALSARVTASVTELPFQEGQEVKAGAVVVRLDDSALKSAVAAAEAGLKAAEADLARTEALLARGAATPRELEEVTARVAGVRAQVAGARDSLAYSVLRAPFAGRVAARRANLGDVVSPGTPLIEIEGEGGLELRATVESSVASVLRTGSKVTALVDGQAGPLGAVVTAIAPAGDPTTHRFEVKADLAAAAGLRAGLFARLLVRGVAAEPRILVPVAAVFERGGLTGVFVVSEGRASLRWVAPGARDGDTVEVRAGLEPGERVVLAPADLADGAAVRDTGARGSTPHPSEK